MIVTRAISLTNFLVASSALGFQVFVLYPWHKELDAGFEELKKEHLRVLDAVGNSLANDQRRAFADKFNELKTHNTRSHRLPRILTPTEPSKQSVATPSAAVRSLDWSTYARYALAGAFCCSFTHAVLTPVDVVKTRIQLEPATYSRSLIKSARHIASAEGAGALLTGLGPTTTGYCLQGAFKFGGYEFFKARAVDYLGYETASNNRNTVYLASAASAEFLGDVALCPFESVRIRLVSQPSYAPNFGNAMVRLAREEGINGLYSGLSPILLKQIPYTMATFLVYEKAIQTAYNFVDKDTLHSTGVTAVNLGCGLIAGLAAAVVSQPADTLLSQINKEKALPGEGTGRRLLRIGSALGIRGAFTGMQARAVMVGGMTAVQFGIYGDVKKFFDVPNGVELRTATPAADVRQEAAEVESTMSEVEATL